MRLLIVDDAARAEALRVRAYAEAHLYRVGLDRTPGDDPRYVAHFGTYKAVFTHTVSGRKVYRRLTVSVPSEKYPNPVAAYSIAELFGFVGWDQKSWGIPKGWQGAVNEDEHCVVLTQEIGGTES